MAKAAFLLGQRDDVRRDVEARAGPKLVQAKKTVARAPDA